MNEIENWLGIEQDKIVALFIELGLQIVLAAIILVVGFWIAKFMGRTVERILIARKADQSLVGFMRSLTSIGLKALVTDRKSVV